MREARTAIDVLMAFFPKETHYPYPRFIVFFYSLLDHHILKYRPITFL